MPDLDFKIEDNKLNLSYNRLRGDVTYSVETSLNLTKWDSTGVHQGTNDLGRVTAWILKENEIRRFLRLRIEKDQHEMNQNTHSNSLTFPLLVYKQEPFF